MIHFAVMAGTVLPVLFLSGWYATRTPADIFAVIGSFLLAGIILWTAAFLLFGALVPWFQARSTRDVDTRRR